MANMAARVARYLGRLKAMGIAHKRAVGMAADRFGLSRPTIEAIARDLP
jgi:hypothetical protein